MGFERKSQTTGENKKKSEAFLNLTVTDTNGNEHKVNCFIPLNSEDGAVPRSLIKAAKDNPDFEIKLTGTVGFPKEDNGEDNLFG